MFFGPQASPQEVPANCRYEIMAGDVKDVQQNLEYTLCIQAKNLLQEVEKNSRIFFQKENSWHQLYNTVNRTAPDGWQSINFHREFDTCMFYIQCHRLQWEYHDNQYKEFTCAWRTLEKKYAWLGKRVLFSKFRKLYRNWKLIKYTWKDVYNYIVRYNYCAPLLKKEKNPACFPGWMLRKVRASMQKKPLTVPFWVIRKKFIIHPGYEFSWYICNKDKIKDIGIYYTLAEKRLLDEYRAVVNYTELPLSKKKFIVQYIQDHCWDRTITFSEEFFKAEFNKLSKGVIRWEGYQQREENTIPWCADKQNPTPNPCSQEVYPMEIEHEAYFAAKHDGGKARMDLVSPDFMAGLGEVMAYGATIYEENTWQQVPDAKKRYLSAAYRHMLQFHLGETIDKDSGLHTLLHCAVNCMFLYELEKEGEQE